MAMSKESRRTLIQQVLKFTAVGFLNTLITLVLIRLLNWVLPSGVLWTNIAYAFGYAVGVVFSYLTNRVWTFQSDNKKTTREFLLFALVNAVSWGVSQLVLNLLLAYSGISDAWIATWCPAFLQNLLNRDFLCSILAMPSAFVINFIGSRWLVFKKKGKG